MLGNAIFSPATAAYPGTALHDNITGQTIFEAICPDFRPAYYVVTLSGTVLCPGCMLSPGVGANSVEWETGFGLQNFDLTFTVDNLYRNAFCCVYWVYFLNTGAFPYFDGPYLREYFNGDPTCSGGISTYMTQWIATLTRTVNSARLQIVMNPPTYTGATFLAFDGTVTTTDCGSTIAIPNGISCGALNAVSGGTATVTAVPC